MRNINEDYLPACIPIHFYSLGRLSSSFLSLYVRSYINDGVQRETRLSAENTKNSGKDISLSLHIVSS